MKKFYTLLFILSLNVISQENEEVPIEELRNNEINALLELVKTNKSIYVNEDNKRLQSFLDKIEERTALLNDAKNKLANEKARNKRLEKQFEDNEKTLTDLEEKLQIKIGVLGELFGVTRQFAGELAASSENSVVFYEFPNRLEALKEISKIKVHNLEELEQLWIAYFDEIVAGGEIKKIDTVITDPDGESFDGQVIRYGLFSASYNNKFVTPASSLNSYKLLAKQPESNITRSLKKHARADDYKDVAIDPTRGFLLSLYLDKPGWFQRIAQGKLIGFIIISIGAQVALNDGLAGAKWLLLTYLFHTIGELILSPIGLAAISSLSPKRFIGQMMGVWFLASSLGAILAGLISGQATNDGLSSMPSLFNQIALIVTCIGLVLILISKPLQS